MPQALGCTQIYAEPELGRLDLGTVERFFCITITKGAYCCIQRLRSGTTRHCIIAGASLLRPESD